jgi:hypothetical protein
VLIKHKQEPPLSPQETNPLVSEDVTRIILKCLAKDKEARYQSAEELLEDLSLVERGTAQGEKTAAARPVRRAGRSAKPWIWAVGGIIVVLVVAFAWYQRSQKELGTKVLDEIGRAGRVEVSRPPQLPSEAGSHVERHPGQKTERSGGLLSLLAPEILRNLSQKDVQGLLDFEKQISTIKAAIPPGTAFDEALTKAYEKVHESKRLNEEGRVAEAQKSRKEGQDEMQKLLTMVAQRDKALEAKSLLTQTKTRLQAVPGISENILFRAAALHERDADGAFNSNDFSGSRTLCSVLTQVYRLSGQCPDAAACLKSLAALVGQMRSAAENPASGKIDPWLKEKANDSERNAQLARARNDLEGAAEQYIQAAFLYQKMIDQES